MKFRDYKKFLISHRIIQKMDDDDKRFFISRINENKPFNNMSYYITKYNMTTEEFNLINKYTFLVNNLFSDDDEFR